ncbi:MAG: flavodoxin [Bacteroidetes bacterium]|nr:MAG: flavodoxin [Bacteroidota bacterium]RLD48931.1 MAG: flavodoxin [Bacteroidota bacterium]RLD73915.1 MAG: flavodoxin [Bacteroidota bacterium]RLD88864.1 MAG: flavodoxin [Bacteroidota bacterium]
MKKIVLLYWREGGNTERAARKIYELFDPECIEIYDVPSFNVDTIENYDLIIIGGSTVGADNWSDTSDDNEWTIFFRKLEQHNLTGKSMALFGLGDQILYPNHFVDDLGVLKEEVDKVGANLIGRWPVSGYSFTESEGVEEDMFYGLALDEDNQAELTDERIKQWTDFLKEALGLAL